METAPKIRITTKQLASGNCQVKFFIEDQNKPQYGYLLVNGVRPVSDVIREIRERLEQIRQSKLDMYRFSFKRNWHDDHNFYLYSA
jgi:hypothetical protein